MQDDYIWELLKFLEFRLIWVLYNYISLQDNLYEDGNYNSVNMINYKCILTK
jgi:hypothetical protein